VREGEYEGSLLGRGWGCVVRSSELSKGLLCVIGGDVVRARLEYEV